MAWPKQKIHTPPSCRRFPCAPHERQESTEQGRKLALGDMQQKLRAPGNWFSLTDHLPVPGLLDVGFMKIGQQKGAGFVPSIVGWPFLLHHFFFGGGVK